VMMGGWRSVAEARFAPEATRKIRQQKENESCRVHLRVSFSDKPPDLFERSLCTRVAGTVRDLRICAQGCVGAPLSNEKNCVLPNRFVRLIMGFPGRAGLPWGLGYPTALCWCIPGPGLNPCRSGWRRSQEWPLYHLHWHCCRSLLLVELLHAHVN
jgi:hypothetical protein